MDKQKYGIIAMLLAAMVLMLCTPISTLNKVIVCCVAVVGIAIMASSLKKK